MPLSNRSGWLNGRPEQDYAGRVGSGGRMHCTIEAPRCAVKCGDDGVKALPACGRAGAFGKRPPPVLLDVRAPEEYRVSRLAGGGNTPSGTKPEEALSGVAKDAPVVVYCSMGYRCRASSRKRGAQGGLDQRRESGGLDLRVGERGKAVGRRQRSGAKGAPVRREVGRVAEAGAEVSAEVDGSRRFSVAHAVGEA